MQDSIIMHLCYAIGYLKEHMLAETLAISGLRVINYFLNRATFHILKHCNDLVVIFSNIDLFTIDNVLTCKCSDQLKLVQSALKF